MTGTSGSTERNSEMASRTTTRTSGIVSGPKRAVLASLAASAALVGSTVQETEAAVSEKIDFARNLTDNGANVDDLVTIFSPDGQKIAYQSRGAQDSNAEGDDEVYVMNALDGTEKKNLSNSYLNINDYDADF